MSTTQASLPRLTLPNPLGKYRLRQAITYTLVATTEGNGKNAAWVSYNCDIDIAEVGPIHLFAASDLGAALADVMEFLFDSYAMSDEPMTPRAALLREALRALLADAQGPN